MEGQVKKKKVDTSIKPDIRGEIKRLTRIFTDWAPESLSLSERNKLLLTDPQLAAVLFAREQHVTPVQIADVLGVNVYRVHQILKHARTTRDEYIAQRKKMAALSAYADNDEGEGDSPLIEHVKQKLSISDTSPRI